MAKPFYTIGHGTRPLHDLVDLWTPQGLEMAKREAAYQVFDHRKAGYQEEILQATDNRGVDSFSRCSRT